MADAKAAYDLASKAQSLAISASGNLFDKMKAKDGILLNGPTGGVQAWPSHTLQDYLGIVYGATYYWSVPVNYAFYDVSKNYISGANSFGANTPIIAPLNASYVRFSIDNTVSGRKDSCVFAMYNPYSKIKWNSLGDSITAFGYYQTYVNAKMRFPTIRNYGVPGTTIADRTGSDTTAFVNRYSSMDTDANLISVMGGTNDWGQDVVLSNSSNKYDKSTLKGAMRTIIEGLITIYPGAYIVWATLPQRNNSTYPTGVNANGNTTQDFADAEKAVCAEYSIPCIDMHGMLGINKYNMTTNGNLMSDGVHPTNPAGHQRIASLFVDTFKQIIY